MPFVRTPGVQWQMQNTKVRALTATTAELLTTTTTTTTTKSREISLLLYSM